MSYGILRNFTIFYGILRIFTVFHGLLVLIMWLNISHTVFVGELIFVFFLIGDGAVSLLDLLLNPSVQGIVQLVIVPVDVVIEPLPSFVLDAEFLKHEAANFGDACWVYGCIQGFQVNVLHVSLPGISLSGVGRSVGPGLEIWFKILLFELLVLLHKDKILTQNY